MWRKLLKLGKSAVNETKWGLKQLEKTRHNIFGTAGPDDWETKLPKKLQELSAKTPAGIFENQAVQTTESIASKIGLDPTLAGLVVGAVLPSPGVPNRSLLKGKKVKPETAAKMAKRDALVRSNTAPKRADWRPADYRGIAGDVQGGVEGKAMRMESRPEYRQAQTGVKNPTGKDINQFTPHHRLGIQDQVAFTANLTPEQMKQRRQWLDDGGLFMGNRGENYESLFDGKLSSKAKAKTGIDSADHFDVHDLQDKMRDKLGIKKNKNDRTLDTFNGKLIKDMTPEQQFAIQAQLALRDELLIDKVQTARMKAFLKEYPNLSPKTRRRLILESPKRVANLSTSE